MSSFGFIPKNQLLANPAVSKTDHSLLKCICPLPRMSDQAPVQQTHHTNSILLRRYWADLPSELCEVKVRCLLIPLWSVSYFFLLFSSRILGWAHLSLGIKKDHFLHSVWSSDWLHCHIFLLVCESTFHTIFSISRSDEWPMSSLKSSWIICHFYGIRNTVQWMSILCPLELHLVLHRIQTTLRTRLIVEIIWSGSSTFHSLLNDYAPFPDTRLNLRGHAPSLSPAWLLDHDTG